jgi:hypothetical protein
MLRHVIKLEDTFFQLDAFQYGFIVNSATPATISIFLLLKILFGAKPEKAMPAQRRQIPRAKDMLVQTIPEQMYQAP